MVKLLHFTDVYLIYWPSQFGEYDWLSGNRVVLESESWDKSTQVITINCSIGCPGRLWVWKVSNNYITDF